MRPTGVACGIQGAVQYIRRHAPGCFQSIDLRDLVHARIAIDATLLTQRLFYRASPDPARHVTGCREVIQALLRVPCHPIMVFDHPNARLPQKAREHARRRAAHHLALQRHSWESARHARLEALAACADAHATLPDGEKAQLSERLRQWQRCDLHGAQTYAPLAEDQRESLLQHTFDPAAQFEDDAYASFRDDEYELVNEPEVADDFEPVAVSTLDQLAHAIHALRQEYAQLPRPRETLSQRSLSCAEEHVYASLESGALGADACLVSHDPTQWQTIRRELERAVQRLECADGRCTSDPQGPSLRVRDIIAYLCAWSARLMRIYQRSSRLVSKQAYVDVMELCRHLHVPVLVSGDGTKEGGPLHEAEALASALVRDGYADMVASEDSDVLLYQVPLLRGLSNLSLELVDTLRVYPHMFPHAASPFDAFLEFALLCGTDFNRTVPGIAATTACRSIAQYGTVEAVLRMSEPRYAPPDQLEMDAYLAELEEARRLFLHPPRIERAMAEEAGLRPKSALPSCEPEPLWATFLHTHAGLSPTSHDPQRRSASLRGHGVPV